MSPDRANMPLRLAFMAMILAGFLAGNLLGLPAQKAAEQGQAPKAASVNNEDCAVCHEDQVKAFDKNPHAILEKSPQFKLKNSCESCHGPGQAHVDASGDKTKIITFKGTDAKAFNRQCLACHQKDSELMGFKGSAHSKSGLACTECHAIHRSAETTRLLKNPVTGLCMGCHVQTRTEFAKPYHHRVKERSMNCVDCHQPHGGFERHQVREGFTGELPCFRCHADKEGPFMFEHASATIRECKACHEPHGSNNPKMLIRSTVRSLCLECHSTTQNVLTSQPPSFHNVRSPRYQNCTTCHTKIHGSNSSQFFLR